MPGRAVSYLRVSSRTQINGDGFPRQREAVAQGDSFAGFRDDTGKVYVYRDELGTWDLKQVLVADEGEAGDIFRLDIALQGGTAIDTGWPLSIYGFGEQREDDLSQVSLFAEMRTTLKNATILAKPLEDLCKSFQTPKASRRFA